MDQCCAPNRPNALSTHSQRIISDHPPKRLFDWESGNAIDTTCKFDILRSQMLLSSKEAVLRPDPNSTHSWTLMTKTLDLIYYLRKKKLWPCKQKTEAWEFRQRSSPAPGVKNSDLHIVRSKCVLQLMWFLLSTRYKIGTSWMGISFELTRQKNYSWPGITSTCWMSKHAFSSTTCGSEENHLEIDINNTTWSKSVSSTKNITAQSLDFSSARVAGHGTCSTV